MESRVLFAAIGIFVLVVVVVLVGSALYAVFKHLLPSIENKKTRYIVGAIVFILLVLGIAPCVSVGVSLL